MKEATRKFATDLLIFAVSNVAFYFAFKSVMATMDPNRQKRLDTKKTSAEKLGGLGRNREELKLNEYEEQIATELILPASIDVDFEKIGGLDDIISSLQESVIAPLCFPDLFRSGAGRSGLLGAPKGVLLYGPPGTGKTMLAKALAKESGATFINMHVSTLTNKWFGESNKLVAALFSLARKLQPCIIFIDEIDSFLRERSTSDHEVTSMMKAEFMTLWDGLTSSTDRILVLGATNRPEAIDQAILRRMPKRFPVRLPDPSQRREILKIMLSDVQLDAEFRLDDVVDRTADYSGSDLKELCRAAAMQPVREFLRSKQGRESVQRARTAKTIEDQQRLALPGPPPSSFPTATDPTSALVPYADEGAGRATSTPSMQARPLRNSDFFVPEAGEAKVAESQAAEAAPAATIEELAEDAAITDET